MTLYRNLNGRLNINNFVFVVLHEHLVIIRHYSLSINLVVCKLETNIDVLCEQKQINTDI